MTDRKHIRKIPEGYSSAAPWIITRDTDRLIDFAKRAFSAAEIGRVLNDDGTIGHAEFRIGDTILLAFDSRPDWPDTPAFIRLYVDDAEATYRRAVAAGAVPVTRLTKLAFGDIVGRVRDPLGNVWWVQERVEELSEAVLVERFQDEASIDAMQYVQESLADELRRRNHRARSSSPA
jgi:PhnB protein